MERVEGTDLVSRTPEEILKDLAKQKAQAVLEENILLHRIAPQVLKDARDQLNRSPARPWSSNVQFAKDPETYRIPREYGVEYSDKRPNQYFNRNDRRELFLQCSDSSEAIRDLGGLWADLNRGDIFSILTKIQEKEIPNFLEWAENLPEKQRRDFGVMAQDEFTAFIGRDTLRDPAAAE